MSLEHLVPHRPPMLWLTEVLQSSETSTTCLAWTSSEHPMSQGTHLPGAVVAEWFAQAAAVHGGLERERAGLAPCDGMVTGCREVRWPAGGFEHDAQVEIEVRQVHGTTTGLAAFEGIARIDGNTVASGTVTVIRHEERPTTDCRAPQES